METIDFFARVFGDQSGRVVLVLPNVLGKPTNDHWFQYPEDLPAMAELAQKHSHTDVWFSPIIYKSDSRVKTNALTTHVLAADADLCEPENFRKYPSMVVQTSEGRWHVYWTLDKPVDANVTAKVNRRVSQVHKDEGCDVSFVNAAKLLRVPGTSNGKHPGEVVIVADYDEGAVVTLASFEEIYPPEEVPEMVEATLQPVPDGLEQAVMGADMMGILSGIQNSAEIRTLLFTRPDPERRSEKLFKLCCLLYEDGHTDETVATLAWHSVSNKFKDEDPRGFRGLWETAIMKAKATVAHKGAEVSFGEGEEHSEGGGSKRYVLVKEPTEFLTLDELEQISFVPTFIDEWVQWAKTKSDAPVEYHEAAAILLLSTIYSQFGYVLPSFGKLKLNIWLTVFGRSTKDRKTTAKSYMERMLRTMSNEEFSYILPGDSTPGGLELALQEREHMSSIISRDEAQGFFEEMLHQSYMSGGISYYTSLYDGRSMGRARASGDKKVQKAVEISFVFFLSGILDDSTSALTIRNFKQGFLTRFLYVIAERPEGYVEPPITFIEEDKKEEDDQVFNSLHRQLEVGRNHWAMRLNKGEMQKIAMSPEAVERFSEFRKDVQAEVEGTKYREIIDSTSDRMTLSTLKLAALLAMHDRKTKVELNHLLQAISFAGKWFDNAVRVASMISESEWLRDVNALEEMIMEDSSTEGIPWTKAYSAFPDKRPKDFEEMVTALESRGLVRRKQLGSRWHLEATAHD